MPAQEVIQQNDERTPLLLKPAHPTPLPTGQLFALSLLMIAEPLIGLSIVPYINELVSQLPITGGDEKKVGYYAGIILSLYFVGEAVTILQWSRLSDFIGRKPVILRGTLGLVVTTLLFGLSRTFWALAASRFLAGALNGNVGVMKSMLTEMGDKTNMSRIFAIGPLSWTIGAALGPYMGGLLSRPQDRWPNVFSHSFWTRYPYFLPCAVASAYGLISLIIALVVLKETLPKNPPKLRDQRDEPNSARSTDVEHNDERFNGSFGVQGDQQEPPPSTLFTRPVLLTIANYGSLSFLETANWMVLPLVYTASVQLGGLGLDPALMGTCMAVWGILRSILQLTAFHRILNFLGLRRTFIVLLFGLVPSFLLFPINGTRAQNGGTGTALLILVLIQLICSIGASMAYGCIFMYISSAAPKGMLGATNGLAQTVVSVQRAIAPAITASLFSFSLEKNIMGGYGVFYALSLCTLGAIWLASRLPPSGW